jgi:phospholipid/cholesterol/gamma-HCH transport system substrate-binding protein
METRANYALIGFFTLAVIAAGFGFVFWFSGGDRGQGRQAVRIVFSGSVSGLSRGSVVLFNGLRVGEVTNISLLPEDPRRVVSIIEVDSSTPVRTDTRARLEYQGLTGVAQIALVGGEPSAPALAAGPGQPLPTIFADRSDFQDLIETARNIARRADEVLESVSRVVADNEGSINRTIRNVETFSDALGQNAPAIDRFLEQVGQAAERIGPLAEKLETLATDVDQVIRAVQPERVARIVENVDSFAQALGDNRQAVSEALQSTASLAARLNEAAPKLDAAITDIGNLARAFDPEKVARSVDNVDRFTQALSAVDRERVARITENVDSFTQALGENRQVLTQALQDAASLIGRLNETAPKLDAAVTDIGNVARAVDPAKIGRSVDNVDKFAEALAAVDRERVARITENVDSFTQVLGENRQVVSQALQDAASLVNRLNDTAPKLDAAIADVGNLARAFDPVKIGRAVDNVDKFTETLGRRSGDVDKAIVEARALAEKLNRSADRVDNVLKAAEGFLGGAAGEEGQSTFQEIREAAQSIRELADNLNARSAGVLAGFGRFADSGLREYEALAVEGRKTLTDISRAFRSIERNPQQFLFGGRSNVPEYSGRR